MTTTYAVYRCPRLRRGESPRDETLVETGFATALDAMRRADDLRAGDVWHTYLVGEAA